MLYYEHQMARPRKTLPARAPVARLPGRFEGKIPDVEDKPIAQWQTRFARTEASLAQHGPMRPGSLSQEYKDPVAKSGAYWQLSYTHNMRSRSRSVRLPELPRIKSLLANFKRFRPLVDRCVDRSVKIAGRQTEYSALPRQINPDGRSRTRYSQAL